MTGAAALSATAAVAATLFHGAGTDTTGAGVVSDSGTEPAGIAALDTVVAAAGADSFGPGRITPVDNEFCRDRSAAAGAAVLVASAFPRRVGAAELGSAAAGGRAAETDDGALAALRFALACDLCAPRVEPSESTAAPAAAAFVPRRGEFVTLTVGAETPAESTSLLSAAATPAAWGPASDNASTNAAAPTRARPLIIMRSPIHVY